jgi:hypothetical protein
MLGTAAVNAESVFTDAVKSTTPPAIAMASTDTRHVTSIPLASSATTTAIAVATDALFAAKAITVLPSAPCVAWTNTGIVLMGPNVTQ